jgi:hypothetical protein
MTDPATLTAAGIATLVITKAFEKTGEMLGEKVIEQSGKLMHLLKSEYPTAAELVEVAARRPDLVEQNPAVFTEAVIEVEAAAKSSAEVAQAVQDVEAAAKADPNLAEAINKLTEAIKSEPSIVQNFAKLAEEIKAEKGAMVAQSIAIENQTNNYT